MIVILSAAKKAWLSEAGWHVWYIFIFPQEHNWCKAQQQEEHTVVFLLRWSRLVGNKGGALPLRKTQARAFYRPVKH